MYIEVRSGELVRLNELKILNTKPVCCILIICCSCCLSSYFCVNSDLFFVILMIKNLIQRLFCVLTLLNKGNQNVTDSKSLFLCLYGTPYEKKNSTHLLSIYISIMTHPPSYIRK